MITERELREAIDECLEEPPSFTSIKKLANLYIVFDHLYGMKSEGKTIKASSHSEFLQAAKGKDSGAVLEVMDELMQTLSVVYPKAYNSVLEKVRKI